MMDSATVGYRLLTQFAQIKGMDKTGRGAGVGDQWIKPGDRELGVHVMHKIVNAIYLLHVLK